MRRAVHVSFEAETGKLGERSRKYLAQAAPWCAFCMIGLKDCPPETIKYHLSAEHLALVFRVSEEDISEGRKSHIVRRKPPSNLRGYKLMDLVYDGSFGLKPLFKFSMPPYRKREMQAGCQLAPEKSRREEHLNHARRRLEYEPLRNPVNPRCQCGIYASLGMRDLLRTWFYEKGHVVVAIRPWGIVEVGRDTLRCTDAVIESIHIDPWTQVDGRWDITWPETCQDIADQFDVDVIYQDRNLVTTYRKRT